MPPKLFVAAALAVLLAACGAVGPKNLPPAPPRTTVATPPPTQPQRVFVPAREAQLLDLPGLEGVIGAPASVIVGQFGQPRLDVREGDARKLQFSGEACVLDVYFYPVQGSREPLATYLDARRASDGLDVGRAACIEALRGR